jgi:hypothetical protein
LTKRLEDVPGDSRSRLISGSDAKEPEVTVVVRRVREEQPLRAF